jgi:hypothetical protein
MAEIRNVNIDKEFIVKFGVCRTNFSDDMLSISLEVLPEAIKEVLQETIVEDGEITVTPVKHGHWVYNQNGHDWGLGAWECSLCHSVNNNLPIDKRFSPYVYAGSKYCPNCGAKMDGGENNET